MNFRVGACALLVCLAGCSSEKPEAKSVAQLATVTPGLPNARILAAYQAGRQVADSIANAPDRGQLVRFNGKAVKREGAYTWYPVAISEAHALKAIITGEMIVPSPDGSKVRLKYERHEEQADGNWTWIGRVVGGDPKQEAILTFGGKAVYGSIPQRSGAPLSLQTRGGALYAVQTDLSKVKNPNTAATDLMVPPAMALRAGLMASKAQVSQSAVSAKASTAASTVDVAIGYTQGFATAQGSDSAAVTRLTFLIAVGNQAFENSLITGALRLVSAVKVDYTDTTTNQTALEELTGVRNEAAIAVPASLAPIRTAREQYGADLAVLVRKFQTPENDGCGIAWLNGAGQVAINPATDDDFGFAVVSDGNDRGTDGNSYFCAEETLVHELSHLMGSAHDRDNSKSTTGALLYGRYPYSFGMKTAASAGNFYTIMAYGENNQSFYRTFSNPLVLKCGPSNNLACGVANDVDNARSLNQTIPVVATFRAAVVPFTNQKEFYAISKQGASGKTEMFEFSQASNYQAIVKAISTGLGQTGTNNAWQFQLGDYNRDGRLDLYAIGKMGASGRTEVHVLSGATNFSTFLANIATPLGQTGADKSWDFQLGDYNKDGILDLYCISKMGASNRTEVHILNGATTFQTFLANLTTPLGRTGTGYDWNFEVADYNGDGALDLYGIYRPGASGRTEVHVINGANSFQSFLLNVATPLGQTASTNAYDFDVGDYNEDGKPDLFFIARQGSSGRTEVHVLSGSSLFQSFLSNNATPLTISTNANVWDFEVAGIY